MSTETLNGTHGPALAAGTEQTNGDGHVQADQPAALGGEEGAGEGGNPKLDKLAERVRAAHDAGVKAVRKGLNHYIAAGRAILEIESQCVRIGMTLNQWLEDNEGRLGASKARCYQYRSLAKFLVTRKRDSEKKGTPMPTTEEIEDQWRRISGNKPKEEDNGKGGPSQNGSGTEGEGKVETREVDVSKGGGKAKKGDKTEDAAPLNHVLYTMYVHNGEVKEFDALLERVAWRFDTPAKWSRNHFSETVRAALQECNPYEELEPQDAGGEGGDQ
jgi:hypothetical protein